MHRRYWPYTESYSDSINIYDSPELYLLQFEFTDPVESKMFVLYWFQAEVLNGGMSQFLENSTGVIAPEVVEALEVVGLKELSNRLNKLLLELGSEFERSRTKRKKIAYKLRDNLDSIDDSFVELLYEENGGLEIAAKKYIEALAC